MNGIRIEDLRIENDSYFILEQKILIGVNIK